MRVLFINEVCGRTSTGRICAELAEEFEQNGDEAKIAYGSSGEVKVNKIIYLPRTNGTKQPAEIYTASDVFVNPTYEDNYPTVNLEAIACGAFVVTYDSGGARETLLLR